MRRVAAAFAIAGAVSGAAVVSANARNVVHSYETPETRPLQTALAQESDLFTGPQQAQAFATTQNAGANPSSS